MTHNRPRQHIKTSARWHDVTPLHIENERRKLNCMAAERMSDGQTLCDDEIVHASRRLERMIETWQNDAYKRAN